MIKENTSPEKALRFANLYSRLLTQTVLKRKWAMLYFLYQLADSSDSPKTQDTASRLTPFTASKSPEFGMAPEPPGASPLSPAERQYVVDSPAFNDAFSKEGLLRLPVADGQGSPRAARLEKGDRKVARKPGREDGEDMSTRRAQDEAQEGEMKKSRPLNPSEPAILRDLPFTLQGVSSTNLMFPSPTALKFPSTLPLPIVSLLHKLAEPSLLYRSLVSFVESSEGGLVGQSLRSAIGLELRSYLGLVATLEGQIRRAIAQLDETHAKEGIGKFGVTLKRCVIWTREATLGLRLMSVITENAKGNDTHPCHHQT